MKLACVNSVGLTIIFPPLVIGGGAGWSTSMSSWGMSSVLPAGPNPMARSIQCYNKTRNISKTHLCVSFLFSHLLEHYEY